MNRFALLICLAACDVASLAPQGGRVGVRGSTIVGGTPTTGDLTVFNLDIRGDNGATTRCSATLIGPRTLLTAAHCVDPSMLGATSVSITASNVPTDADVIVGVNTVRVVETRLHPSWTALARLGNDLALLLLERAQTASPSPWNRQPLAGLGGEPVRAVGYGADAPDAGRMGTKRTVDLSLRQLTAELIYLGNLVDKGICHGDSGGPTFLVFGDGVERLVGVHSFTRTEDCLDGADTRVDAKASFILQWLSEKDASCRSDFVCAVGGCLPLDVDCVALGSACDAGWQCRGRACVNDVQHTQTYCSKACSTDGDCAAGLSCDVAGQICQRAQLPSARPGEPCLPGATFCISGSVCTGPSADQARCSQPCVRTGDCLSYQQCRPGFSGTNACFDPPPITLPVARVELPAERGCSVGMGNWSALCLLWFLRRRFLRPA